MGRRMINADKGGTAGGKVPWSWAYLFFTSSSSWRSWCNGNYHRKWTWWPVFESWMELFAFHISLIHLGKWNIQLFSFQLWINRWYVFSFIISLYLSFNTLFVQSAGVVEYTVCISAEWVRPPPPNMFAPSVGAVEFTDCISAEG